MAVVSAVLHGLRRAGRGDLRGVPAERGAAGWEDLRPMWKDVDGGGGLSALLRAGDDLVRAGPFSVRLCRLDPRGDPCI